MIPDHMNTFIVKCYYKKKKKEELCKLYNMQAQWNSGPRPKLHLQSAGIEERGPSRPVDSLVGFEHFNCLRVELVMNHLRAKATLFCLCCYWNNIVSVGQLSIYRNFPIPFRFQFRSFNAQLRPRRSPLVVMVLEWVLLSSCSSLSPTDCSNSRFIVDYKETKAPNISLPLPKYLRPTATDLKNPILLETFCNNPKDLHPRPLISKALARLPLR